MDSWINFIWVLLAITFMTTISDVSSSPIESRHDCGADCGKASDILRKIDDGAECPNGVDKVSCAFSPCDGERCEAYPEAVCVNNYCGGCTADFYFGKEKVNCKSTCPEELSDCSFSPCLDSRCNAYPGAKCRTNRCGGCKAEYYINGKLVNCQDSSLPCEKGVIEVSCPKSPCSEAFCPAYPLAVCKENKCGSCKAEFWMKEQKVDCMSGVDPSCGPGIQLASCFLSPCTLASCPSYPHAECRDNFCGGCNADFYVNGINVDCFASAIDKTYCPSGTPLVSCATYPCLLASCPAFPQAKCVENYCGECSADFYMEGEKVDCSVKIQPVPRITYAPPTTTQIINHTTKKPEQATQPSQDETVTPTTQPERTISVTQQPKTIDITTSKPTTSKPTTLKTDPSTIETTTTPIGTEVLVPTETTDTVNECSNGIPIFNCFANPCDVSSCPAFESAKCIANYCGGCNAVYYVNGKPVDCGFKTVPEITKQHPTTIPSRKIKECPFDKPLLNCPVSPCLFADCPAFPDAVCTDDFCGGCNAVFSIKEEIVNCSIEDSITTTVPITQQPITTKQLTTLENLLIPQVPTQSAADISCPDGRPRIRCLFEPCSAVSCVTFPSAICRSNYCGGCNAEYYLGEKKVNCEAGHIGSISSCENSPFGCCVDGVTMANGAHKEGCPGISRMCNDERNNAVRKRSQGIYIPQCKQNGQYERMQCWTDVRLCWCVNLEGQELFGTRTELPRRPNCQYRDCRQSAYGCCPDDRNSALGPHYEGCPGIDFSCMDSKYGCCPDGKTSATGPTLAGCPRQATKCERLRDDPKTTQDKRGYIPQCEDDGTFKDVQCSPTTGECWCVNKVGSNIPGSKVKGIPNCEELECVDRRSDCYRFTSISGYCQKKQGYMKTYCAKSCNFCYNKNTATPGCGSPFGCCDDKVSPSAGPNALGCPEYASFCQMPPAPGVCRGALHRYYFDTNINVCVPFLYGGCKGNQNNFKSMKACQAKCGILVASLPPVTTIVSELITTQEITVATTVSSEPISTAEAKTTISTVTTEAIKPTDEATIKVTTAEIGEIIVSTLSPVTSENLTIVRGKSECEERYEIVLTKSNKVGKRYIGLAQVFLPRCRQDGIYDKYQCSSMLGLCWCVDTDGNEIHGTSTKGTPKCQKETEISGCKDKRVGCSVYSKIPGYCQSNKNFMDTNCKKSCNMCHKQPQRPGCQSRFGCCVDGVTPMENADGINCQSFETPCAMPVANGNCKGAIERYFYNAETNKCENFLYSGCRGNQNNFVSKRICQIRCGIESSKQTPTTSPGTSSILRQTTSKVETKSTTQAPQEAITTQITTEEEKTTVIMSSTPASEIQSSTTELLNPTTIPGTTKVVLATSEPKIISTEKIVEEKTTVTLVDESHVSTKQSEDENTTSPPSTSETLSTTKQTQTITTIEQYSSEIVSTNEEPDTNALLSTTAKSTTAESTTTESTTTESTTTESTTNFAESTKAPSTIIRTPEEKSTVATPLKTTQAPITEVATEILTGSLTTSESLKIPTTLATNEIGELNDTAIVSKYVNISTTTEEVTTTEVPITTEVKHLSTTTSENKTDVFTTAAPVTPSTDKVIATTTIKSEPVNDTSSTAVPSIVDTKTITLNTTDTPSSSTTDDNIVSTRSKSVNSTSPTTNLKTTTVTLSRTTSSSNQTVKSVTPVTTKKTEIEIANITSTTSIPKTAEGFIATSQVSSKALNKTDEFTTETPTPLDTKGDVIGVTTKSETGNETTTTSVPTTASSTVIISKLTPSQSNETDVLTTEEAFTLETDVINSTSPPRTSRIDQVDPTNKTDEIATTAVTPSTDNNSTTGPEAGASTSHTSVPETSPTSSLTNSSDVFTTNTPITSGSTITSNATTGSDSGTSTSPTNIPGTTQSFVVTDKSTSVSVNNQTNQTTGGTIITVTEEPEIPDTATPQSVPITSVMSVITDQETINRTNNLTTESPVSLGTDNDVVDIITNKKEEFSTSPANIPVATQVYTVTGYSALDSRGMIDQVTATSLVMSTSSRPSGTAAKTDQVTKSSTTSANSVSTSSTFISQIKPTRGSTTNVSLVSTPSTFISQIKPARGSTASATLVSTSSTFISQIKPTKSSTTSANLVSISSTFISQIKPTRGSTTNVSLVSTPSTFIPQIKPTRGSITNVSLVSTPSTFISQIKPTRGSTTSAALESTSSTFISQIKPTRGSTTSTAFESTSSTFISQIKLSAEVQKPSNTAATSELYVRTPVLEELPKILATSSYLYTTSVRTPTKEQTSTVTDDEPRVLFTSAEYDGPTSESPVLLSSTVEEQDNDVSNTVINASPSVFDKYDVQSTISEDLIPDATFHVTSSPATDIITEVVKEDYTISTSTLNVEDIKTTESPAFESQATTVKEYLRVSSIIMASASTFGSQTSVVNPNIAVKAYSDVSTTIAASTSILRPQISSVFTAEVLEQQTSTSAPTTTVNGLTTTTTDAPVTEADNNTLDEITEALLEGFSTATVKTENDTNQDSKTDPNQVLSTATTKFTTQNTLKTNETSTEESTTKSPSTTSTTFVLVSTENVTATSKLELKGTTSTEDVLNTTSVITQPLTDSITLPKKTTKSISLKTTQHLNSSAGFETEEGGESTTNLTIPSTTEPVIISSGQELNVSISSQGNNTSTSAFSKPSTSKATTEPTKITTSALDKSINSTDLETTGKPDLTVNVTQAVSTTEPTTLSTEPDSFTEMISNTTINVISNQTTVTEIIKTTTSSIGTLTTNTPTLHVTSEETNVTSSNGKKNESSIMVETTASSSTASEQPLTAQELSGNSTEEAKDVNTNTIPMNITSAQTMEVDVEAITQSLTTKYLTQGSTELLTEETDDNITKPAVKTTESTRQNSTVVITDEATLQTNVSSLKTTLSTQGSTTTSTEESDIATSIFPVNITAKVIPITTNSDEEGSGGIPISEITTTKLPTTSSKDVTTNHMLPDAISFTLPTSQPTTIPKTDVLTNIVTESPAVRSKCQADRQQAIYKSLQDVSSDSFNLFIPTCLDNGDYSEVQCTGSSVECWCVDLNGVELSGTRVQGKPYCGNKKDISTSIPEVTTQVGPSLCELKREAALEESLDIEEIGLFIPTCDLDGSYAPVQCSGSTIECWCVDREGVEVIGSRAFGVKPACKKRETPKSIDETVTQPIRNIDHHDKFHIKTTNTNYLPSECEQPVKTGPCRAKFQRWYFDNQKQTCAQFVYGGCEGNENNFASLSECANWCLAPLFGATTVSPSTFRDQQTTSPTLKPSTSASTTQTTTEVTDVPTTEATSADLFTTTTAKETAKPTCELPVEIGPCRARIQRWYFDNQTQTCIEFFYGGCRGNKNNFESLDDCSDQCLTHLVKVSTTVNPSTVQGQQTASTTFVPSTIAPTTKTTTQATDVPTTLLSSTVQEEQTTVPTKQTTIDYTTIKTNIPGTSRGCGSPYGCCDDTVNGATGPNKYGCPVYESICQMPVSKSNCEASITRYYYDSSSKSCQPFIWGGCNPNGNNFDTQYDCEIRCGSLIPTTAATTIVPTALFEEENSLESGSGAFEETETGVLFGCPGKYGCCEDGITSAEGPNQLGCPKYNSSCDMPAVGGSCVYRIVRWHYDKKELKCKSFMFNGCGGNANNFIDAEECNLKCGPGKPTCFDRLPESCPDWKRDGICGTRRSLMSTYCRKSCGFC